MTLRSAPVLWALLLALASLAALPPADAQSAQGALYMTPKVVRAAGGCNDLGSPAPPTEPIYAMAPEAPAAAAKAYTGLSVGGTSCEFNFNFTATQASVLDGEIRLYLNVGCDVAGAAIELDYNFFVAGTSVSSLRPAVSYQCTSSTASFDYNQKFDGKKTAVKEGDELRLTLNLFAAATGLSGTPAQNWHIKTGVAGKLSGLFGAGLPVLATTVPAGPAPTAPTPQSLNGSAVTIGGNYAQPTTLSDLYVWSTNLTKAQLISQATIGNGTVQVEVRDGANATAFLLNASASENRTLTAENLTAGNWTIALRYTNFTGTLSVSLSEPPAASPPPASQSSTSSSRSSSSVTTAANSTTTAAPMQESKGSPGPAPLLFILLLASLTFVMRRRL